jgi:hypothetical protein
MLQLPAHRLRHLLTAQSRGERAFRAHSTRLAQRASANRRRCRHRLGEGRVLGKPACRTDALTALWHCRYGHWCRLQCAVGGGAIAGRFQPIGGLAPARPRDADRLGRPPGCATGLCSRCGNNLAAAANQCRRRRAAGSADTQRARNLYCPQSAQGLCQPLQGCRDPPITVGLFIQMSPRNSRASMAIIITPRPPLGQ